MSSLKLSKNGRIVSSTELTPKVAAQNGFWANMAELKETDEFKEFIKREYPEQESQFASPLSRRRFVQIMGASFAFAGIATQSGCRWKVEKILPLSRRPEGYIPGVAKKYATAFELGGSAAGLVVTCMEGRPIKIEGNPEHPYSGGSSTGIAQASILELYDPDRSKSVRRREAGKGMSANQKDALDTLRALRDSSKGDGKGLHILSESSSSPTIASLRKEISAAMPALKWHEYEALSRDEERLGNAMAFGVPMRSHYLLDRCKVIATFDTELFGNHPATLKHSRDFASTREPDVGPMSRLYAIESCFSLTGAVADHRFPVRSELIKPLLLGLEKALAGGDMKSIGSEILHEEKANIFISALAADLKANAGSSLVTVGSTQPAEVHAIAARINETLRNTGKTIYYVVDSTRPGHLQDMQDLIKAMNAGKVSTLLILGGNPVYDAPVDLKFATALGKVKTSLHLSMYDDETSKLVNWHLNRSHYLESWGDSRSYDGTHMVMQPLVEPLYKGMSIVQLLKLLAGHEDQGVESLLRKTMSSFKRTVSDKAWRKVLHDGFVPNSATVPVSASLKGFQVTPLQDGQTKGSRSAMELTFRESATYDGRYANSGWLVETPDFITKLTWDNAALISPATANDLGVANGDMLSISVGGNTLEIVAHVTPGQAAYSIGLPLGWGRKRAGYVGGHEDLGVDSIGFDTYKLRSSTGFHNIVGATVKRTGKTYPLAESQEHFAMDTIGEEAIQKRADILIKTDTFVEYKKIGTEIVTRDAHLDVEKILVRPIEGRAINASLYDEHEYKGHKWGMTIDLGKCTGCNACSLACQSENNIAVIGKEEVMNNRIMHWIRIDRYFKGSPDNPQMAFQPVHCQQCEGAPCEVVCPVEATVHSDEGLNDMTYNRCVGTRYCANNCPYRVRRFNFKYWNKDFELARFKVRKLLSNPDVTVRERGVMEKCTWCVQRIERVKIDAKNKRRPIVDGEIQVACEQACPSKAIRFGDLADKQSVVYKNQELPRAYALLASLNNSPRNAYLARITNPNPALTEVKAKSHE